MKALFFLVITSYFALPGLSQTKFISHKSHSGSNTNSRIALEKNLFDINGSNFKLVAKTLTRLDSVIFVNKNKIILVTRSGYYQSEEDRKIILKNVENWQVSRTISTSHYLFSKNHSLDSVKAVLTKQKLYINDLNSAVFVGYDNTANKK